MAEPASRSSPHPHLLVPFASCAAGGCQDALRALELPALTRLLALLTSTWRGEGDEYTLSPPHERALARLLALPGGDGTVPWAAHHAGRHGQGAVGEAWAFITPCHWQVHSDHITMDDTATLRLGEAHAHALLGAMQPYFAEDGITLRYDEPMRWLARGELFRGLACASPDRVSGRDIDAWMPGAPQAAPLRRLQNEMQMLLYTHAVNDERAALGLAPVNSFWVSGAGALDAPGAGPATTDAPATTVAAAADMSGMQAMAPARPADAIQTDSTLRAAALREDWPAWAAAWQALDAGPCAALLKRARHGEPVGLTLCGERHAQTFELRPRSLLSRLTLALGARSAASLLQTL